MEIIILRFILSCQNASGGEMRENRMSVIRQAVIALALGGPVAAFAAEPPSTTPRSALRTPHFADWRDTQNARDALADDKYLLKFNLGVRVQNGVARLWGPVPDVNVAERAVERLRAVPGIRRIVDATHLIAEDVSVRRREQPKQPRPGLPDPVITLPLPEPEVTTLFPPRRDLPQRQFMSPSPAALTRNESGTVVRATATLLGPVAAPSEDLRQRVAQDLAKDSRFRAVYCHVENRVVTLSGRFERWEDLWDCVSFISRLPQVERVVIGKVTRRP